MSTAAPYDEIADYYDEWIRTSTLVYDLVLPSVLDLVGDVEGQRICDLACGQGIVARRLAERGARIVGVDISVKLLNLAKNYEQETPSNNEYVQGDAQELAEIAGQTFDGVVCNMALMDIPDLEATLRTVARILKSGGWFVFSITHPCFQTRRFRLIEDGPTNPAWAIQDYFEEGFWRSDSPNHIRGKVGFYHHTLSTYLNILSQAGLTIACIVEPRATGRLAESTPIYREVPVVLVARCQRL